ncbi:Uncharacterised protein [Vibrio cholerae]|nr:Uncharacterised protein [Vibrio cholerae]
MRYSGTARFARCVRHKHRYQSRAAYRWVTSRFQWWLLPKRCHCLASTPRCNRIVWWPV